MKRFALLLSTAPITFVPTILHAQSVGDQTAQAADTPDPQDTAKKAPTTTRVIEGQASQAAASSPGAPAGAEQGADASSGDVVVTGLRQSLATASAIKRNSDSILDAVVAQDIGKLPDDTAAESLARIAGVQVNRYNDEVTQVLIRGLPNVATTFNGREVFTAEARQVALQDFPAQALAGIEVYKSGTADLVEPGLAGLVNVRSRRPFDFKGLVVGGGERGTYNDQSKKFDPSGNLLFSDRWNTGLGEVGLLVNATYSQSQYSQAIRYNDTFITQASQTSIVTPAGVGNNIYYPYNVGLYDTSGKRWRPSGNFAAQWQPSNDLSFYLEGLYQGYRENYIADQWNDDLRGNDANNVSPTLSNVTLVPGTNQVASLLKSGGYRQQAYRSTNYGETNTYQLALGGKWATGPATLSTDFAYTTSKYKTDTWSIDSALASSQPVQVNFNADGGAAFSLPNFNINDASQYVWRGYYEAISRHSGSGFQWRGDLTLNTDPLPLLHTLQFGYRVTTRLADYSFGSRYAATEELAIPFASLPFGALSLTQNSFRGNEQGFTQYLAPSYDGVRNNQAALRALARQALQQLIALHPTDQGLKNSLAAFQPETVALDPFSAFHANEKTYAAYVQGKYGFGLGSIAVDGAVGLRAVITDGRYFGTSQTYLNNVQTVVPSVIHQDYLDLLPNASMRVKFTDKLQLRLAYTFTRTKPEFGQLNPAFNVTQVIRDPSRPIDPNDPNSRVVATGTSGNPNLKPLTSHNYDASLEWYFSKTGFISGAVFYRDLFGFINNYTRYLQDPTYGFVQFNRPENAGEGHILGAEGNFQTFLDFLPGALKGIGVQGNVTYLDGKNRTPIFDQTSNAFVYGPFAQIPSLSKWAYNASLFYERNGITTRLSYNRRSSFVTSYGTNVLNNQTTFSVAAVSRLDFSFGYDVTKRITVSADASNLLAQPFHDYVSSQNFTYTQDVRDEGRYIGLGFRFRFGE